MERNAVLRDYYIKEYETFLAAIDRLLAMPGRYFDPAVLPDPGQQQGFCERYSALRSQLATALGDILGQLPDPMDYEVARGPGLPVDGCLLRSDMESMRRDVQARIAALSTCGKG